MENTIELDEIIPEQEEVAITNINETKRYTHLASYPKQCPFCASSFILSDADRVWYCYQCGAHELRQTPHKPVTEQELREGKLYAERGKRRPLHEFTCEYPGCDEKFMTRKNGKNTRRYCERHKTEVIGMAHTRAGIAKRRLAHEL
jgi:ribosomal protein L37AE/L43A